MHLHHNHMPPFPDTAETLRRKIVQCLDAYAQFGIFCLPDGSRKFAFIHGDWALDNAGGPALCGVNNEITVLKECGCYADFTFPSLGKAQPAMINRIYYATDDPGKPKSYNWGTALAVNGRPCGDLLMIPGILGLRVHTRNGVKLSIEASNIDASDQLFSRRIDYWVRHAVRVPGRPEWRFVKLHTHGAKEENFDSLFGEEAGRMYDYLEQKYNDGKRFVLHYVTAREMYNIAKAAEAGRLGNPALYRDFVIPRYGYRDAPRTGRRVPQRAPAWTQTAGNQRRQQ
jgi:hypothetical protein